MSIERRVEKIPASGELQTPRGNFFLLLTASALVNMRSERSGTSEGFNGIIGGLLIRRVLPWDFMRIVGTAGTDIEYLVGHEEVIQDESDVRLGISSIAGSVTVVEKASETVKDTAPLVVASGTQVALFAANAARRRIRVYADSLNFGSCFVRVTGGANNIGELVPGMSMGFETLEPLDIRNDTGGNCTFYIFEEE